MTPDSTEFFMIHISTEAKKRILRTVTVDCHKESKKQRNNCLENLINDGTLGEQFFL